DDKHPHGLADAEAEMEKAHLESQSLTGPEGSIVAEADGLPMVPVEPLHSGRQFLGRCLIGCCRERSGHTLQTSVVERLPRRIRWRACRGGVLRGRKP